MEKSFTEALANSLPGIVYLFDHQARLLWWNRHFEDVTGYSSAELAGSSFARFVPTRDRAMMQQQLQFVLDTGASWIETALVLKSGVEIPYHFTGQRMEFAGALCL